MAVVLDTSALIQLERSTTNTSPPVGPAEEGVVLPAVVWAEALIGDLRNAEHRLCAPVRRETVFRVNPPLENACTGCYNLVHDGDRILMYYRGLYPLKKNDADFAES